MCLVDLSFHTLRALPETTYLSTALGPTVQQIGLYSARENHHRLVQGIAIIAMVLNHPAIVGKHHAPELTLAVLAGASLCSGTSVNGNAFARK